MGPLVDALETAITGPALWAVIAPFAGIIVVLTLFGLGRVIFRRIIGGASRGKAKV